MTEKKEMLLIEKTQWESLVSKVRDLTQQVTILKESYVPKSQYYTNRITDIAWSRRKVDSKISGARTTRLFQDRRQVLV